MSVSVADPTGGRKNYVGLQLDLRATGNGEAYLIAGWSYPEPDYTWSLGVNSLIRLPLSRPVGDCLLKLRCGPMVRPPALSFQRIVLSVNTIVIGRMICRGPTQYEFLVPGEALRGAEAADIVFHLPDARAPKNFAGSVDSRELGIWVSSLHLAPLPVQAVPAADPVDAADKAMLERVQSLGENCELGFVQRAGGAEPLGLFRWASTPLPNLLAALAGRFEGLGEPANLVLELDEVFEFQVIDTRYGFKNHSWAYQNAGAKREDVFRRECARLPYLARLMLEDLRGGEKLFCFHDAGQSGMDRVRRLAEALGVFGPNWLLWVCPAEHPGQVGTAEMVGERLIRGYIDAFQPLGNVRSPSLAAWMATLRAAIALWQEGSHSAPGSALG